MLSDQKSAHQRRDRLTKQFAKLTAHRAGAKPHSHVPTSPTALHIEFATFQCVLSTNPGGQFARSFRGRQHVESDEQWRSHGRPERAHNAGGAESI